MNTLTPADEDDSDRPAGWVQHRNESWSAVDECGFQSEPVSYAELLASDQPAMPAAFIDILAAEIVDHEVDE